MELKQTEEKVASWLRRRCVPPGRRLRGMSAAAGTSNKGQTGRGEERRSLSLGQSYEELYPGKSDNALPCPLVYRAAGLLIRLHSITKG